MIQYNSVTINIYIIFNISLNVVLCENALTHSDWNVEKPILFEHHKW